MSEELSLLRAGAIGSAFICVLLLVHALVSAPAPALPRLGVSGANRQRSLTAHAGWRLIEPLIRRVGRRLDAWLGERQRESLRKQIRLAGDVWGLLPGEFVALILLGATFGAALGGVLVGFGDMSVMAPCIGAVAGALFTYLQLSTIEQERKRRAEIGLPYVIDLLALALSAGADFPGALRQVVSRSSSRHDPLMEELGMLLHELEVGRTRSSALEQLAERLPTPAVREFVAATLQAEKSGTPLATVLRMQAVASRQRRSVRAEESAAKAGVKMMVPLLMGFACVGLLLFGPLALDLMNKFN